MSPFSIQVLYLSLNPLICIEPPFPDTDSFYLQISDFTWEEAVTTLRSKIDFSNLPPDHDIFKTIDYNTFAIERKAQFSFVKIDTGEKVNQALC